MKKTLYRIYFTDDKACQFSAYSPMQAAILAQAYAISTGSSYQVKRITNKENGEEYTIEQWVVRNVQRAKSKVKNE